MAIWISKFLGPVILTLSVPMIAMPRRLQATTQRFLADTPLILVTGILAMTAGLAIVNVHNLWVLDWPLIITLFGWALLVGGAARIIAPGVVEDVGAAMLDRALTTRIVGVIWGCIGVFLTIQGYA